MLDEFGVGWTDDERIYGYSNKWQNVARGDMKPGCMEGV